MKEFMASSGVLVVEIAVVLIVIVSAFGIYLLRRKKGTETEAKSFVKKINGSLSNVIGLPQVEVLYGLKQLNVIEY